MAVSIKSNEKGSAVVLVLIFLGIVSIIGVGLLLQSQLDLQFTAAVTGSDHRLDMSEGGVSYMFPLPPNMDQVSVGAGQTVVVPTPDPNSTSETSYWTTVPHQNQTDLRRIYIGAAAITDCAGYEIGRSGDYRPSNTNKYYYVLDALAGMRYDSDLARKVPDRSMQQSIIQMGCLRCQ